MPEALPTYRVVARNTSAGGENPIHDDAVARRHGFPGALVPGITLYAYLVHPLVEVLGAAWLRRGTAEVRFVRPVLDGEEVTVSGAVTAREAPGLTAALAARTAAAGECAVLSATLPAGTPTPVNPVLYPSAPLPAERPPASRELLERLEILGSPRTVYDAERAERYLASLGETLGLFQPPAGFVHPAVFLEQANRAVDRNLRVGPWIHVASHVRHLGGALIGEGLETRGRVRSLWEKKGREYLELDLVVVAGPEARPAAHVRHTVIYRLPEPAAPGPR